MEDPKKEEVEACRLARRAIDLSKHDAVPLCLGGWTLGYVGRDLRAAVPLTERALKINPNLANGWLYSAWLHIWLGEPQEALKRLERAKRLSPLDPFVYGVESATAHALYQMGRLDEAAEAAERGLAERPTLAPLVRIAAAIYGLLGSDDEARKAVARLRTIDPALRITNLWEALGPCTADYLARYQEGLRKAGVPE